MAIPEFKALIDQFFHLHLHGNPLATLMFYLWLHDIRLLGNVQPVTTEIQVVDHANPNQPLLKRIVDGLFKGKARFFGDKRAKRVIIHIEHQNRNQRNLMDRLVSYFSHIFQRYKGVQVIQIVVFTGDKKFWSNIGLEWALYNFHILKVDLTATDPVKIMSYPDFHIQCESGVEQL
jgi:hypothetical protein